MMKCWCTLGLGVLFLMMGVPDMVSAQDDCSSLCNYTCSWGKKIVTNGQPGNSTNEVDNECHWGTCNRGCSEPEEEEDLQLALASLDHGDFHAVGDWILRDPLVGLNPDRNAVQVLSPCSPGLVQVHIPLDPTQFYEVLAAIPGPDLAAVILSTPQVETP